MLGFGFVCGLAGAVALAATALARREPRLAVGAAVYIAGLLAMLGCSLVYRAAIRPRRRRFLRRFDHAAIFAMIAGSATPFALARGGGRGAAIVAALWSVAALGMVFKLGFPIGGVRRSAVLYLALGWASYLAVAPAVSSAAAALIAAGGASYSIGVPFLLWRRLPYRLAIWHVFVLAGAAFHYFAIFGVVRG